MLLVAVATVAWFAREPQYALSVEPESPRAGESIRVRTTAPGEDVRGRYFRLERRDGDRWTPVLDLAPAWEWGPAHAKPAKGEEAAGPLRAFSARGVAILIIPERTRPGRYRLRQRLFRDDPTPRDLYVQIEVRSQ